MALLMLSLNCTQAAFQFISNANKKVKRAITETQCFIRFGLIDEVTGAELLDRLELSQTLLEQILNQ